MTENFDNQIVDLLPRLQRYARSLSRSMPEAEDLVQDTLEAAIRGKSSWRGINFKSWMMTIMTNVYRNRNRSGLKPSMMVGIEDATEVSIEIPVSDPFERDRLWAAINALPVDYRTVLMLVVVEGYKYADVADMLAVPLGTVMSRLSRARKLLSERLRLNNVIPLRSHP